MSLALLLALGCGGDDSATGVDGGPPDAGTDAGAPLGPHPGVDDLPDRPELPPLLVGVDGVEDWERTRRAELVDLLSFYVYGYVPDAAVEVTARVEGSIPDLVAGAVDYDELELTLGSLDLTIHVSLFRPAGETFAPVFVAPNRCGNQEVSADARIRATTAWIGSDCGASPEDARGVRASQWPIEAITAAGFALAAFHESEIDPDDASRDFADGVHARLVDEARDPRLRWGRLSAWAWGVARVVDGLEASGRIDPARVAVVGHSRRGKTALLAGALDERIGLVVAHQSGTGGAALSRSLEGESIEAINLVFPSWFDDVFPTFAGHEVRLPVDQHMLVALAAPRLVLVTDGDDDAHADPAGARRAVEAASEAWSLYGVPGVVPGPDGRPTLEGRLSWQSRPGGHALTHADWDGFLAFARAHWP